MILNCEFFYGNKADQFKFFRIPQVLVTDSRFKNITYGTKITVRCATRQNGITENIVVYAKFLDDGTPKIQKPEHTPLTVEQILDFGNYRDTKQVFR